MEYVLNYHQNYTRQPVVLNQIDSNFQQIDFESLYNVFFF